MFILMSVIFILFGLAIGSFLNVCIDRLPPKRFLKMTGKNGEILEIEVSNKTFFDDPVAEFKDKDVCVKGKLTRDPFTGNHTLTVFKDANLVLQENAGDASQSLTLEEAISHTGETVTISGHIVDGYKKRTSLVSPPSHCDNCGHKLRLLDNVPILSYLFLGGKCRYCKAHIPMRVLLVEFLTAAVFFLAYWRYGSTPEYCITVLFACFFIVIIFVDWEQTLILNSVTYPALVIALILLAVDSFVPGVNLFGDRLFVPQTSLYSGLISGGALFLIFILIAIITPGSMGIGDAKLVALIGLVSGFPLVFISMIIGIVIGGVVAIVLLATRKKGRKDVIPYGTFLAIGPLIALLLPSGVIDWYLSMGH
jgi:leader peptidase (prepilin peptidase) / N-methyltransferase